jgi:hypothetical protein
MKAHYSDIDKDFLRWLSLSRQFQPDYGLTWDQYHKETKYIGVHILKRNTSMTRREIGGLFSLAAKAVDTVLNKNIDQDELARVEQVIRDMVFNKIIKGKP